MVSSVDVEHQAASSGKVGSTSASGELRDHGEKRERKKKKRASKMTVVGEGLLADSVISPTRRCCCCITTTPPPPPSPPGRISARRPPPAATRPSTGAAAAGCAIAVRRRKARPRRGSQLLSDAPDAARRLLSGLSIDHDGDRGREGGGELNLRTIDGRTRRRLASAGMTCG